MNVDTENLCSHLKRKLFDTDGEYHQIWVAIQQDDGLTAVARNRQLHVYRDGRKVLILAGKSLPKIVREDRICGLLE